MRARSMAAAVAMALALPAGAATIQGRVLEEADTDPIGDIRVQALKVRPSKDFAAAASACTAAGSGSYSLTVGPGRYILFARQQGGPNGCGGAEGLVGGSYADEYYAAEASSELDGSVTLIPRDAHDQRQATVIEVADGDALSDVDIHLDAGTRLWGCLKTPDDIGSGAASTLFVAPASSYVQVHARDIASRLHHVVRGLTEDSQDAGGRRCWQDPPSVVDSNDKTTKAYCPYTTCCSGDKCHQRAPSNYANACSCPPPTILSLPGCWGCELNGSTTGYWAKGNDSPDGACNNTGCTPPFSSTAHRSPTPTGFFDLAGLPPSTYDVLVYDSRARYRWGWLGQGISTESSDTTQVTPAASQPPDANSRLSYDGGSELKLYLAENPSNDTLATATVPRDAASEPCCDKLLPETPLVHAVPCGATNADCTALTPGAQGGGSDVDRYKIRVVAGQRYVFTTTSPYEVRGEKWPLVDTMVGVTTGPVPYLSSGQILAYDDDSAGYRLSRLEMTFPESTDYYVVVTTANDLGFTGASQVNAGEYGLQILRKHTPPRILVLDPSNTDGLVNIEWLRVRENGTVTAQVVGFDPDASPVPDSWLKDEQGNPVDRLTASSLPAGAELCKPRLSPSDPCDPPDFDHGAQEVVGLFSWTPSTSAAAQSPYKVQFTMVSHGGRISRTLTVVVDNYNQAPGMSTIESPANNGFVGTLTPTIRVANAIDPEGDPLVYFFQIKELDGPEAMTSQPVPSGATHTEWTVVRPLVEDHRYTISVWAFDGRANGPARTHTFVPSVANAPPSTVLITKPAFGEKVQVVRPQINASKAMDPEGDPIAYRFEMYADAALTQLVVGQSDVPMGTTETAWVPSVDLEGGKSYWVRARATDSKGASGPFSAAVQFGVEKPQDCPDCQQVDQQNPVVPPPSDEPSKAVESVSVPSGCSCQGAAGQAGLLGLLLLFGLSRRRT